MNSDKGPWKDPTIMKKVNDGAEKSARQVITIPQGMDIKSKTHEKEDAVNIKPQIEDCGRQSEVQVGGSKKTGFSPQEDELKGIDQKEDNAGEGLPVPAVDTDMNGNSSAEKVQQTPAASSAQIISFAIGHLKKFLEVLVYFFRATIKTNTAGRIKNISTGSLRSDPSSQETQGVSPSTQFLNLPHLEKRVSTLEAQVHEIRSPLAAQSSAGVDPHVSNQRLLTLEAGLAEMHETIRTTITKQGEILQRIEDFKKVKQKKMHCL